MTVEYLSIGQVLALHAQQLRRYGGRAGMRDRGALESALGWPAATFGGEDLYPDIADKAAALMHSLALNHPFVDGNKRGADFAAIIIAKAPALLYPLHLEQVGGAGLADGHAAGDDYQVTGFRQPQLDHFLSRYGKHPVD